VGADDGAGVGTAVVTVMFVLFVVFAAEHACEMSIKTAKA